MNKKMENPYFVHSLPISKILLTLKRQPGQTETFDIFMTESPCDVLLFLCKC